MSKNKNLQFIFLGRYDIWEETKEFISVKNEKIYTNCMFFNEFIDTDLFMSFVQKQTFYGRWCTQTQRALKNIL